MDFALFGYSIIVITAKSLNYTSPSYVMLLVEYINKIQLSRSLNDNSVSLKLDFGASTHRKNVKSTKLGI